MPGKTLKSPRTLYKLCLKSFLKGLRRKANTVIKNEPIPRYQKCSRPTLRIIWKLEFMPATLVADILHEMAMVDRFKALTLKQLENLNILDNLLRDKRTMYRLFMCWELVKDFIPLHIKILLGNFPLHWKQCIDRKLTSYSERVKFGLRLGSLLTETGWITEAIQILSFVLRKIRLMKESDYKMTQQLDCLQRLLHCETMIWDFAAGKSTLDHISKALGETDYERIPRSLIVNIYTRASAFELARHKYKDAHEFSVCAMQYLSESMPKSILVDALRTTAKACMAIRDYELACTLIKQAISIAKNVFGREHLKFADVMYDYAYFLLIFYKSIDAAEVYAQVASIRFRKLSNDSFLMALTNAAFANVFYLRHHKTVTQIEKAVSVMTKMLPPHNLLLASTLRLSLLIKDTFLFNIYERYYKIHKESFLNLLKMQIENVNLCVDEHGEMNLFTAKNYFELARLYQGAMKYQDSKRCIAKCILITKGEMSSSEKDLHVLEDYLEKTDEQRDILCNVRIEPWLLNKIETGDRALEEKNAGSPRFYEGLQNLFPPGKQFHKRLRTLAAEQGWKFSSENDDFWCIEYLKDKYFKAQDKE